jgi:hypothetical protein
MFTTTNESILTEDKKACFEKIETNYEKIKKKIIKEIGIVYNFENSRSAQVPWLERTGFPFHLKDLLNAKIYSSYKLLLDRKLEEDNISDPVLICIINTIRSFL